MKKQVAIVLGGTVPHEELIRLLRERGYYSILVDYRENLPAGIVADKHIRESTLDYDKVLVIAKTYSASLVISACVDQANIIACKVSEDLGLKPPYSSKVAMEIGDKITMKEGMKADGIPTADFEVTSDPDHSTNLRYPVIVKPNDSNSSNKVKRANNEKEIRRYLREAIEYSRSKKAIIEEYITGREISAYFFVTDHRARLLLTSEKVNLSDDSTKAIKNHVAVIPADLTSECLDQLVQIGQSIADRYRFRNMPMFIQAIVSEDGINVIEFAPRMGGGACFETIRIFTGIDLIEKTIDSWEGTAVNLPEISPGSDKLAVCHIYAKSGVYGKTIGEEKLLNREDIILMHYDRMSGEKVDAGRAGSSRICYFVIRGKSIFDIKETIRTIYNELDVLDESGESILDRSLVGSYLK